jgi:ribA/ribD-fused uncharacterized protein
MSVKMSPILGFFGRYKFLSNFHPSPIDVDGSKYPTVEHAFQALKSTDPSKAREVRKAETPGIAKRLGQKVPLREDWEQVKDDVMYDLLKRKFTQNESLKRGLLATGNEYLEETNTWHDTYWGVCNGKGLNKLGHLLMRLRAELQK